MLGRKLVARKNLKTELLAFRVPHRGKPAASVYRVNLGYWPPFDKASAKASPVGQMVSNHCLPSRISQCRRAPLGLAVAYSGEGLRQVLVRDHLYSQPIRPPACAKSDLLLAMVFKGSASPFCSTVASAEAYEIGYSHCASTPPPFQVAVANSEAAQRRAPLDVHLGGFQLVAQSELLLVGANCAQTLPVPSSGPTLGGPGCPKVPLGTSIGAAVLSR